MKGGSRPFRLFEVGGLTDSFARLNFLSQCLWVGCKQRINFHWSSRVHDHAGFRQPACVKRGDGFLDMLRCLRGSGRRVLDRAKPVGGIDFANDRISCKRQEIKNKTFELDRVGSRWFNPITSFVDKRHLLVCQMKRKRLGAVPDRCMKSIEKICTAMLPAQSFKEPSGLV